MNGGDLMHGGWSRPGGVGGNWLWPVTVSLVLHVLLIVFTMVAPSIWKQRRPLEHIVTVDLVSTTEGPPDAAPGPPAAPSPPPKPKAAAEPTVSITPAETPPPAVEAAPEAKPVSLAPLKRKKQKADDTRLAEDREKEQQEKKKKDAEEQSKKLAEQKKRAEENRLKQESERKKQEAERARQEAERLKRLAEQARRDAGRAQLNSVRESIRAGGGGGSRGGSQLSLIEQQYFASLVQHIRPYWDLPEMKAWPRDTEAVAVISIAANGKVLKIEFERRAKDGVYNQYVEQALRKASPMPPFPAAMQRRDVEVGLRFKPGDLGSM